MYFIYAQITSVFFPVSRKLYFPTPNPFLISLKSLNWPSQYSTAVRPTSTTLFRTKTFFFIYLFFKLNKFWLGNFCQVVHRRLLSNYLVPNLSPTLASMIGRNNNFQGKGGQTSTFTKNTSIYNKLLVEFYHSFQPK